MTPLAAGLFRGIRHASAWDASREINRAHTRPTEDLMETAAFRAGFATLGRMGHSFDAWLYHPQIDQLTALCRAHPEVTVICDHLGGPLGIGPYAGRAGRGDGRMAAPRSPRWRRARTWP